MGHSQGWQFLHRISHDTVAHQSRHVLFQGTPGPIAMPMTPFFPNVA
ncbi:hypothetical protein Y598_4908 [Burkholderia pseudomallei MSHR3335]|nr:hypothetical protein Y598_4908 [Burkholderia pseudomallei MSHR3335]